MRAVGDAVSRLGFSDLQCNRKNKFKSESLEVLELGVIKCVRVDRFLSTAYLGAVFDPWSLCGSRARESDPSGLQALG